MLSLGVPRAACGGWGPRDPAVAVQRTRKDSRLYLANTRIVPTRLTVGIATWYERARLPCPVASEGCGGTVLLSSLPLPLPDPGRSPHPRHYLYSL